MAISSPSSDKLNDALFASEELEHTLPRKHFPLHERDPRKIIPPLHGALLKNEQDVHLFERLAFLNRRGS